MSAKLLVACPVYNEVSYLPEFLDQLRTQWASPSVFIDDGSSDESYYCLQDGKAADWMLIQHSENKGYGATIRSAIDFAISVDASHLITIDSDLQHDPKYLQHFLNMLERSDADIVSGSRYLSDSPRLTETPRVRYVANILYKHMVRHFFGLKLSDVWCGMKAYKVESIKKMRITANGYGMPLEFWGRAAAIGLKVDEVAVPRLYHPPDFQLDNDKKALQDLSVEFLESFIRGYISYSDLPAKRAIEVVLGDIEKYLVFFRFLLRERDRELIEDTLTQVRTTYNGVLNPNDF